MAGLYTHTTRASGTVLTAVIYNSDHQNHIDNDIPAMMDDYSINVAQMQSNVDPGEVGTESLATSLAGEIERIRFVLKELKGTAQWYQSASGIATLSAANTFTGAPQTITNAAITRLLELISTDAGAALAAMLSLFRDSVSPAANDFSAGLDWFGRSSTAVKRLYAEDVVKILDPTNTLEDAARIIRAIIAGTLTDVLTIGPGVQVGAPPGGDKGPGTLNVQNGIFLAGVSFGVAKLNQIIYNTVSGSYAKPGNLSFIIVEVIGGGGAGGSAPANGMSAGGGSGGFCRKTILAASLAASETVTVGAAGARAAAGNNPGGPGGASSFGAFCTGNGGSGGGASGGFGGNGGSATGGDLNVPGSRGSRGDVGTEQIGVGGDTIYGSGGRPGNSDGNEQAGSGFGAAGSGVGASAGIARQGGNGAPGIVIIYEYTTS